MQTAPPRTRHLALLLLLWLAVYLAACARPPLLDDADSTHAEAAQAMLRTGDWVTLRVDGVRYLEKPPLPYWMAAVSMQVFGENAFAVHLPLALTVLLLALLARGWAAEAFGDSAGEYAGLMTLTSAGVFLFTRIFIPDALLSLLLLAALWALERLTRVEPSSDNNSGRGKEGAPLAADASPQADTCANTLIRAGLLWLSLALAVLAKGLVALLLVSAAAFGFLLVTGSLPLWRRLRPVPGAVLFLAVAAPWHILSGLRNTAGPDGHGFFWFYFVNEHVLRFLGRRIPRDYNKLPATAYWLLHLVWLFPWSAFLPATVLAGWQRRRGLIWRARHREATPAERTTLLLLIFSTITLVFFSLSTNQEYYTFPVYAPALMLVAASVARSMEGRPSLRPWFTGRAAVDAGSTPHSAFRDEAVKGGGTRLVGYRGGLAALTVVCLAISAALGFGLWSARGVAATADIGTLLAHRGVGQYTLSMSRFFDLTGLSFAALRLPATLALVALAAGPAIALWLAPGRPKAVVPTLAATFAVFLVAAHLALIRFGPMLGSQAFADQIAALERHGEVASGSEVLILGDQAFGSSLAFYLGRRVLLVDGRTTSMQFGSGFADAPPIFPTHEQLLAGWGNGPRKLLFIPEEQRERAAALLGARAIPVFEQSRKLLVTDRPLDTPAANRDHGVHP